MKRAVAHSGYRAAMSAQPNEPATQRGGDYDLLWMIGIGGVVGFGLWTATRDRLLAAAARHGLAWTDATGYHPEPLAWVTLALVLAGVGGAVGVAGWASAARRWKSAQLGGIPRPPTIAAGMLAGGVGWVVALLFTGGDPAVFGVTGALVLAGAAGVGAAARRAGHRWVAAAVFIRSASDVLGFANPGLARVRAGKWTGDQPGVIRATTGPGWRGGGADLAALDRAALAAGWGADWRWRTVITAAAVIGERRP